MLGLELIVCSWLCPIIADWLLWCSTAALLPALVIMRPFLFTSSFIAACSLYAKLDFSFFGGCFIGALISFSTRSIYVLTTWCFSFGVHFSLILILKGTYLFGWFTVAIQVSSLKWARSLISQKKFCKSVDFCKTVIFVISFWSGYEIFA